MALRLLLKELKEHLDKIPRHSGILACPAQIQFVALMILVCPFQFRRFHDSVGCVLHISAVQLIFRPNANL